MSDSQTISDYAADAGIVGAGMLGAAGVLSNKSKKDKKVAILYGYQNGKGSGHKIQAERYKQLIQENSEFKPILINGAKPLEILKGLLNRNKIVAKINTGWGFDVGLSRKPRIVIPKSDYSSNQQAYELIYTNTSKQDKVDKILFNKLLAKNKVPIDSNSKYITLAAGGSGIGLQDKADSILKHLKDRPDIKLVALTGELPEHKVQALREIGKKHNGRLHLIGKINNKDFVDILRNSDANIGYGGSSSITEQLGFKNPNLLYTNSSNKGLNTTNMEFAKKHYNINYYMKQNEPEMAHIIKDMVDNPTKYSREESVEKFLKNQQISIDNIITGIRRVVPKKSKLPKRLLISGAALGTASIGAKFLLNKKD